MRVASLLDAGAPREQRTHERPNIQVERNPFDLANVHMTPPVLDSLPDPRDQDECRGAHILQDCRVGRVRCSMAKILGCS